MDTFIVAMLNTLSKGVNNGVSSDLLKNPAQYEPTMYAATAKLHEVAIVPVTAVVLSIVAVLALSENASRIDSGDHQLGVRMIAATMFRVAMVLAVTSHALLILKAIDEVVQTISTAANAVNVGNTPPGRPLGDALATQITSLGVTKQLVLIVVLLLPYLCAEIISVLASVLIFVRFLQIYLMTAFASLPLAFAGMEGTKNIAVGYVKRYASVALQGAVLILSIKMYQALSGAWLSKGITVTPDTDVWNLITDHLGTFFIGPLVLGFLLFGSTQITRAIVGEG